MPVSDITGVYVLNKVLRPIEQREAVTTAHQVRRTIGQILRYAYALGKVQFIVTDGLKGALELCVTTNHRAAITDPIQLGEFLRAGRIALKSVPER